METRYWVRDASLSGLVGPLSLAELRAAVLASSLPRDAEVCPERADGKKPGDLDPWQPAFELLGLEPPPRVRPVHVGAAVAGGADPVLDAVRLRTRYPGTRKLLGIAACAASLIALVITVVTMSAVRDGGFATIALFSGALQMAVIWVAYNALVMLADLADCALRREAAARTEST
jgi:hypothetical protein